MNSLSRYIIISEFVKWWNIMNYYHIFIVTVKTPFFISHGIHYLKVYSCHGLVKSYNRYALRWTMINSEGFIPVRITLSPTCPCPWATSSDHADVVCPQGLDEGRNLHIWHGHDITGLTQLAADINNS